jgi:hypothetical protein
MKLMLPSPPYHLVYLIVKLFRIKIMFMKLKDYFISIGPFIDTPSTIL